MTDALVLLDLVNDLVSPEGKLAPLGVPAHVASRGTLKNCKKALDAAHAAEMKVIFVRVSFSPGHPEVEGLKAPFYLAHKANNWLVKETWGTEFHADVQPSPDDLIIDKSRVNPFTNPEFEAALQGAAQLVVAGVSTNLAVEETVRNAAAKGFDVVVLENCCASNNQAMHDFSVESILSKFAKVTSVDDFFEEV